MATLNTSILESVQYGTRYYNLYRTIAGYGFHVCHVRQRALGQHAVVMDETTVKEVLTGAFSKVLSALQNPSGNWSSSHHDGSSSVSGAGANEPASARSGTTSDSDDLNDLWLHA